MKRAAWVAVVPCAAAAAWSVPEVASYRRGWLRSGAGPLPTPEGWQLAEGAGAPDLGALGRWGR